MNSSTGTPIISPRLSITLRTLWLVAALGMLLIYALAVPEWLEDLSQPAAPPINPATYNLTAQEVAALEQGRLNISGYAAAVVGAQSLAVLFAAGIAALIFLRRSNDWLALIVGLWIILLPTNAPVPPGAALVSANRAWYGFVYGFYALFTISQMLAFTLFPTRRFHPRWLRWPVLGWGLVGLLVLHPEWSWADRPETFGLALGSHYTINIFGIIQQYRNTATREQRNQVKWALFSMVAGFTIVLVSIVARVITEGRADVYPHILANLAGAVAFFASIVVLCVGFSFSILRYKLWEIDFVINRSLVYAAITVVLAVVFAGAFFAVQAAFQAVLGGEQPTLAVAAATALVVGLYSPTRSRLTRLVDQRVYGIELDYHKALAMYAAQKKAARDATAPHAFGDFTRLELIGRGGMGEVYLGRQLQPERNVAIKLLPEQHASEELRRRFQREAEVIAALQHPNIVSLYDYGDKDGQPYMVMEFLEGRNLKELLEARGRFDLPEALGILDDIASALDYAHQRGVVHRDIKSSNVMMVPMADGNGRAYRPVLTDFGVAKTSGASTQLTGTGMIGTLAYIAPEQIHGAAVVDGRADIYSLGVTAFEVLTGVQPFRHNNPGAMVMAHLLHPPPDPCEQLPELPEAMCAAVRRAMAKDPAERFASAGEFVRAMAME